MTNLLRLVALTVTAAILLGPCRPKAALAEDDEDRRERRSRELVLPDEYLDPSWPLDAGASHVDPEKSDNVENVPLDDEQAEEQAEEDEEGSGLDEGELGAAVAPDEIENEDPTSDETRVLPERREDEEYEDPVEW